MNKSAAGALAAFVTVATSVSALAVPLTVNPGPITATGQSSAVFLFSDAADKDQLALVSFAGNPLFDNKVTVVGATTNLGVRTGTQVFTLNNMTTGLSFSTGVADSGPGGDGYFHARYSTDYSSFGVGALSGAASTALSALPAGQNVLFVGFEDRRGLDYDYNDLIFAFVTQPSTAVPEPSTLMVLGFSLVGLGMIRRKMSS